MIKKLTIHKKIIGICTILAVVPICIIMLFLYFFAKGKIVELLDIQSQREVHLALEQIELLYNTTMRKVKADLKVAEEIVFRNGRGELDYQNTLPVKIVNQITKEEKEITIPGMKIGGEQIINNYKYVDYIQNLVGGTATIFQVIPEGLLRISTNVMTLEKARAVGTYIPKSSPVYKTIMKGETYFGRAFVVNYWYLTAYKPFKDAKGEIIGVLYVGVSEKEHQEFLINKLSKYKIGRTGYFFILNEKGEYILSYNRERDGENVINYKDSDGKYFIKNLIQNAKTLSPGSTFSVKYPWKNKNETEMRDKISTIAYFKPWKWIIAASFYEEEQYEVTDQMQNGILIIFILTLGSGLTLTYFFGKNISSSIQAISRLLLSFSKGNLTLKVDDKLLSKEDEIGEIANSALELKKQINKILKEVQEGSHYLEETSIGIANISNTFSENIQHQAASIEEISATMEELSAGMDSIYHNSTNQQSISDKLYQNIDSQTDSINLVNSKVIETNKLSQNINQDAESSVKTIRQMSSTMQNLVESSTKMTHITEIINGVSEQINLLSLNASIESARAGEFGRGFSVVASEISKLAEQTASSIKDIVSLLSSNHKEIRNSTERIETTSSSIQKILGGIKDVETKMEDISKEMQNQLSINEEVNEGSRVVQEKSEEIKQAIEEQKLATEDVTTTIQSINDAIQNNSNVIEDMRMKSQEFAQMAIQLKETISYFVVDK